MKVRLCSDKFPWSWEAIKRQPCLLYIFHTIIYSRHKKLKDSSMLVNKIETSRPMHYLDCFLFYIFYKFNFRTVSKHYKEIKAGQFSFLEKKGYCWLYTNHIGVCIQKINLKIPIQMISFFLWCLLITIIQ